MLFFKLYVLRNIKRLGKMTTNRLVQELQFLAIRVSTVKFSRQYSSPTTLPFVPNLLQLSTGGALGALVVQPDILPILLLAADGLGNPELDVVPGGVCAVVVVKADLGRNILSYKALLP